MNKKSIVMCAAGLLLGTVATAGMAQDQGGFGPGGGRQGRGGGFGGQRGFGGGPGGGQGRFGQGGPGMGFGQPDHNPLVSHAMELIKRTDVQTGIRLDLKQKNALTQYEQQSQQMVRSQMQQAMQNLRNNNGQGGGQPGQGGRPDPTQMQQMREQMQAQRAEIQGKVTAGLNELLRPDQVQRLHELDLQWRGVLSIADPKVAEEAQISQEHRAAISALHTQYQQKVNEARQQMFQNMRGRVPGGPGGRLGGGQPGQPGGQPDQQGQPAQPGQQDNNGQANPQQGQNRNAANPFQAIQKADEAARKEAEEKALALLSPEEKANWTKIQGRTFTFRTDLQTTQR